jgi:gamma-glutamylcyclotransferase (GGCT)/AIG2-like uncharacterized protein YtfP
MFYYSYGSNISEYRMITERNISFKSRKLAILENYKLVFNKVSKKNCYLGFANIVESAGDIVQGALYEIDDSDIDIIDWFEGAKSKISHYNRANVEVFCDNKKVEAVTYIANPTMIRDNIKPDKNYLNYILEGKDLFSADYYGKLLETKTLD